jgi:RNA polymerase sigma-70 factor (ECF subfamily)
MPEVNLTTPFELLTAARGGNAPALGVLLESYSTYLTLLARMQIGAKLRGKVDPGDIVQEVFLEVHRQFPEFRGTTEAEFLSWVRRILAGQLAQTLRRFLGTKGRDVRMEQEMVVKVDQSSAALDRGFAAPGSSPSHSAARRERSVLLADALNRLPADYREVIVLRHIEALSFAETGERMGRSENSVQKLWVRALAKLREELGELE